VLTGAAMLGAVTFLPIYLQIARGVTPMISGLLLAPMTLGIIAATTIAGRYMRRTGRYRALTLWGMALVVIGALFLTRIAADTSILLFSAMILFYGFAMGLIFPVLTTAVQNAVPRQVLGTATASGVMFRQIGGSLAVAVFGAIMTARLAAGFGEGMEFSAEMGPQAIAGMDPALRSVIATHVVDAIAPIYWIVSALAALGVLTALRLQEIPLVSRITPRASE